MSPIQIVHTAAPHVDGFHRCVDTVARERRFLGFVEGPPIEHSRAFVEMVIATGGVHVVAVNDGESVVGWCDITRFSIPGFTHGGRLGMGLLPEFRGQGLGRQLAEFAIEAAAVKGIERIELEVFSSNARAVRLYERMGFLHEGVKRRARKLDGVYDDNIMMARISTGEPQH